MCRDNVESPYYQYSGRGVYDIRYASSPLSIKPCQLGLFLHAGAQHYEQTLTRSVGTHTRTQLRLNSFPHTSIRPMSSRPLVLISTTPTPTATFTTPSRRRATSSTMISWPIWRTCLTPACASRCTTAMPTTYVPCSSLLECLAHAQILARPQICNWFGGEAVSLSVRYAHSAAFAAAGYAPFVVDGTEYGEVRQVANFSFLRIYEAGHEVPWYQPQASLALFNRTIHHVRLDDGSAPVSANTSTEGEPKATHTEPFVLLQTPPSASSSAAAAASSSAYPHFAKPAPRRKRSVEERTYAPRRKAVVKRDPGHFAGKRFDKSRFA